MTTLPFARSVSRTTAPDRLMYVTATAFVFCFATTIVGLVRVWLQEPEAAHGLLIAPVALWLAYSKGVEPVRDPRPWIGSGFIAIAAVLTFLARTSGAETVPRVGLIVAAVGFIVWYWGWGQVMRWWLPLTLLALTIPLPASLIGAITLPLQQVSARLGANLLAWRHIPVLLSGNIIRLPGHTLFVSEACSGLRSLTALMSMAVLVGALFLRSPFMRLVLVTTAIGVAILVNGVRIFLTGFLVYFVDPALGEGFMHLTEGYLLFLVSLSILAALCWVLLRGESLFRREQRIGRVEGTERWNP